MATYWAAVKPLGAREAAAAVPRVAMHECCRARPLKAHNADRSSGRCLNARCPALTRQGNTILERCPQHLPFFDQVFPLIVQESHLEYEITHRTLALCQPLVLGVQLAPLLVQRAIECHSFLVLALEKLAQLLRCLRQESHSTCELLLDRLVGFDRRAAAARGSQRSPCAALAWSWAARGCRRALVPEQLVQRRQLVLDIGHRSAAKFLHPIHVTPFRDTSLARLCRS